MGCDLLEGAILRGSGCTAPKCRWCCMAAEAGITQWRRGPTDEHARTRAHTHTHCTSTFYATKQKWGIVPRPLTADVLQKVSSLPGRTMEPKHAADKKWGESAMEQLPHTSTGGSRQLRALGVHSSTASWAAEDPGCSFFYSILGSWKPWVFILLPKPC